MAEITNLSSGGSNTTTTTTTTTTSNTQWETIDLGDNELDLKRTLLSGQSFIWSKHREDPNTKDGIWIGTLQSYVVLLKRNETRLDYQFIDKNNNINHIDDTRQSIQMRRELISDYFNLQLHLPTLIKEWSQQSKPVKERHTLNQQIDSVVNVSNGIRLLRQDPTSCLFSFICSQNNNIGRISKMVNSLCEQYGTLITTYDNKRYFEFPTLDQLCKSKESELNDLGFGYRSKYIVKSALQVKEKGGSTWLNGLRLEPSYEKVNKELTGLMGVGNKVADCVSLFSLDKYSIVPIDTHIWKISKKHIPSLSNQKSLTPKIYNDIRLFWVERFGNYSGWAHTLLFANAIGVTKEKESNKRKQSKESTKTKEDQEDEEEEDTKEEEIKEEEEEKVIEKPKKKTKSKK